MPTQNRRDYVRNRARREFRANQKLTNTSEIQEAFITARDNLALARAQRKHLSKVLASDNE